MKKKLSFLLSILLNFLVGVFTPFESRAETYRFHWFPPPGSGYEIAGRALEIDAILNTDTNSLSWTVNFVHSNGVLPQGFQLAFNDGPNPNGVAGELPFLYFDATNMAQPKLTAYVYNGANLDSWEDGSHQPGIQPPDRILTSVGLGPPFPQGSWVKELIARDEPNGTRTFGFVIDTTQIDAHIPLYPNPPAVWEGANFGLLIGIWFHPVSGLSTQYSQDGFLSSWTRSIMGWYDTANQSAVLENPICFGVAGNYQVALGQSLNLSVTGRDNQGNLLNVAYTGLPPGSVVTPPAGNTNFSEVVVNFSWSPVASDSGASHQVNVIFTDSLGASVQCPFTVNVPANQVPLCAAGLNASSYQNISCAANKSTIQLDGTASVDVDAFGPGLQYKWTSNCPGATFNDSNTVTPQLTFNTEDTNKLPASCKVALTVSDGIDSALCEAVVTVQGCARDCVGSINGVATFDICGVCGGNGTACLDCIGMVNGTTTIDQCGVCGGDGTSCLACEGVDILNAQLVLDSNAKHQDNLVRRATRRLRQVGGSGVRQFVSSVEQESNKLSNENWVFTWSLPNVITQCGNPTFCTAVSLAATTNSYEKNSARLRDLARLVIRRTSELRGRSTASDKKLTERAKALHKENLGFLNTVPETASACT